MENKFLFTLIIISLCLPAFIIKTFAQEDFTKKTFKTNKGGKLSVSLAAGDIHIKTWEKNEVEVLYGEEDDYADVKIFQDGSNITIRSNNFTDFEITVPSVFNLDLNSSGGDILILDNIKGEIDINTSGGDIKIKDVNGDVRATTAGGDVRCGNINGNVKFSSSGGDIVVGKVEGECVVSTGGGDVVVNNVLKTLTVGTGGGNVTSGNVGNDVVITTGGGDVSVSNISGNIVVTTGGGNISGTKINKGGSVVTGAGDVVLKGLSDGIAVTSGAGNVITEFSTVGSKKSKVITGYGDITVYIPDNAKATITAKVRLADMWTDKKEISEYIQSDFKASGEDFNRKKGEYKAVYNINGGGTEIQLETTFGQIMIKKLKR